MSARAMLIRYWAPWIDENGNMVVTCESICIDPAIQGSGLIISPEVRLVASNPGGWSAQIKAAIAASGVAQGYPDLIVANVYIPTYG